MKILIFGRSGMLGQMLFSYLDSKKEEVFGTQRNDKDQPFYFNIQKPFPQYDIFSNIPSDLDYIINCIGITNLDRSKTYNFRLGFYINAFFPTSLYDFCRRHSIKLIHISTDAVFKESLLPRYEDDAYDGIGDYAISKILGEVQGRDVLNIRCSIVGCQANRSTNLLSWFILQEEGVSIFGYTNHIWNGVTTLQLSKFIHGLVKNNGFSKITSKTNILHFSPNKPISKYDLLILFKEIFKKNIDIKSVNVENDITRILHSRFSSLISSECNNNKDIKGALIEMKEYFLSTEE